MKVRRTVDENDVIWVTNLFQKISEADLGFPIRLVRNRDVVTGRLDGTRNQIDPLDPRRFDDLTGDRFPHVDGRYRLGGIHGKGLSRSPQPLSEARLWVVVDEENPLPKLGQRPLPNGGKTKSFRPTF